MARYRIKTAFDLSAFFVALCASVLLTLQTSCIRTGLEDDCEFPVRLHFSYVYNRENRDLLREEVPNITLFLFDIDSGELAATAEYDVVELPEDATVMLYAPPGRYSLVTWGGTGDRYTAAGESLEEHDCRIGAGAGGDVSHRRQHLWNAVTDGILVNGRLTPTHEVELLKLSNDITVSVHSTDGSPLSKSHSDAYITASNGRHDFSGAIHCEPMAVRYIPESEDSQGHVSHEFTTLSLHRGDDSTLKVSYGEAELYSGSLTRLIAEQPDIEFGLDDEFHIRFDVAPSAEGVASVSVSVNGWKVDDFEVSLH